MNDILFRGKNLKDTSKHRKNIWIYGNVVRSHDGTYIHEGFFDLGYPLKVDPKTVGQYINKVDKHNVEIFDGDICQDVNDMKFIVKYNADFCCYFLYSINDDKNFMAFYPNIELEIIGNIHDNPELL